MRQENYKKIFKTSSAHKFSDILAEGCTRCTLSEHGCKPIVFRGSPEASILLLGECPGQEEEKQKKPFVGPAGQLLEQIFEKCTDLDIDKDICITNVAYCRPTAPKYSGKQNYTPKAEQLDICYPFVEKFIEIIKPKIIIACGRIALGQLTGDKKIKIGQWEGKWLRYKNIPMFVMSHPAQILHMSNNPKTQYNKKLQVKEYMEYFNSTYKEKLKE